MSSEARSYSSSALSNYRTNSPDTPLATEDLIRGKHQRAAWRRRRGTVKLVSWLVAASIGGHDRCIVRIRATPAHRVVIASVEHRQSKYLNNRAENSHQPSRQRERAMKQFRSIRHVQRFLPAFGGIWPHFRPRRHLPVGGTEYRLVMADRFAV